MPGDTKKGNETAKQPARQLKITELRKICNIRLVVSDATGFYNNHINHTTRRTDMISVDVTNVNKSYPAFRLRDASFSLETGKITGFIGRNGAGKTTAIKAMLNLIHKDSGEISYFGMPLSEHETEIKQRIGYSTGTVSWYPRKTVKEIVDVTKAFYSRWNEDAYRKYMALFALDETKRPVELSEGMKVKFNLMLALSHDAEVLILDEPTSGLDPFSRDELLELFKTLKEHGVTIMFSTHIISDLEKCADNIIYISGGKIMADCSKEVFTDRYGKEGESLEDVFLRMEREVRS